MNEYESRLLREKERFDAEICVHDLPEIFHYWSNKYLRPMLNAFGYDSIEDFFVSEIAAVVSAGSSVRVASVGCGDCAPEVHIAKALRSLGVGNVEFTCLDISEAALARAQERISEAGLDQSFVVVTHDFNEGLPAGRFDVVMANQSLHHVLGLEKLYDSVARQLEPGGRFLVSDMIGRNGHQRWPEARALVDDVWQWLPERFRYNRQLRRQEDSFLDWDCSIEGFEGVRAEDVLPLILERFSPSVFIVWGNIIDVFIDRGFGHNFDVRSDWDARFIDRVQEIDDQAIRTGRIKPTHLVGSFCKQATRCVHREDLSPYQAVRSEF